MSFTQDFTNVDEVEDRTPVPQGVYILKVVNVKLGNSREKGFPMPTVDFVIEGGQFANRKILYHNVVFLPPSQKGAGIAKRFLKALGLPHEGVVQVNPLKWLGLRLKARVFIEDRPYKNNSIRVNTVNNLQVWHVDDATGPIVALDPIHSSVVASVKTGESDKILEEVPFIR